MTTDKKKRKALWRNSQLIEEVLRANGVDPESDQTWHRLSLPQKQEIGKQLAARSNVDASYCSMAITNYFGEKRHTAAVAATRQLMFPPMNDAKPPEAPPGKDPRALLQDLVDANPDLTESQLRAAFRDRVEREDGGLCGPGTYTDAIIGEVFRDLYRELTAKTTGRRK